MTPEETYLVEALRQSRTFLDNIVENLPAMVFLKDAQELRFVRFNKAGEDLLGYSRQELLGKNDYDFFPRQEADFFTEKDKEVLNNRVLVEIPEEPIKTRLNGTRFLHTRKIPLLDKDGRPEFLLGISVDITERRQTEQIIAEQSRALELYFEHTLSCLALLDSDFNFIRVNRAYAQADQRDVSEFPGRNHFDLYPSAENRAIFEEVLRSKQPYCAVANPFEYAEHPERGVTYWDWTLVPVLAGNGDVECLLFSLNDVTVQIMAQKKLQRETARSLILTEYAKKILAANSIEEITIETLKIAQQVTESRFGFVGYIDPATGNLVCPTMTNDIWEMCNVPGKEVVFSKFGGLWGWVLNNKRSLMTNNPALDSRSTGVPAGHIPINNFISCPAFFGDTLDGQIALANAPRPYDDDDMTILEQMAIIFALGIRKNQAENSRRKSALYVRSLIEASLDPLVTINRDGKIMDVNRATEMVTGRLREELIGSDFCDYFTNPVTARVGYQQVFTEGKVTDFLLSLQHVNGTVTDVLYNATLYKNEAGEVEGVFAAARDITEQKLAMEKMNAQYSELQRWQEVMLDREERIMHLKEEVNELLNRLREPPRYGSVTGEPA